MHDRKKGHPTIRPFLQRAHGQYTEPPLLPNRRKGLVLPSIRRFRAAGFWGASALCIAVTGCSGAQFISAKFIAYSAYSLLTASFLKAVRITEYHLAALAYLLTKNTRCRRARLHLL
ncbi:hypothetical protein [Paraburkholderia xenovorans]|uniref:hypothetical protein n=1 Tax=Paraburkholderia xenovorans TaxID=36873 RepID=UPI0038BA5E9B